MPSREEEQVQLAVCDYLKYQYPDVLFRSDYASGLKLTMGQAIKHKRMQSSRAWPDLFIYEARMGYQGLAIELKKPGVKLYKRDGSLVADQHVREQAAMLKALEKRGYKAVFAVGLDQALQEVQEYLEQPTQKFEGF